MNPIQPPTNLSRRTEIMKSKTVILLGVILLFGVNFARAQSDGNAKDLYFGYKPRAERRQQQSATVTTTSSTTVETRTTSTIASNDARNNNRRRTPNRSRPATATNGNTASGVAPSVTGLPGTKITIELMRKGKLSFVQPTYAFRSGDKIRLRMKTNFEGYVAVLNLGSSGKVNLLYPVEERDNYVKPTADYQIPQGDGWIVFDDTAGTEIVSVIMSEDKLQSFADLDGNSDYFRRDRTSKDLFVQTSGSDFYAVFRDQPANENVGFTLKLKHKK